MENVYKIIRPTVPALPLIFDSPHSGRIYPADFGHACPLDALHGAEDNHVDELLVCVPGYGAALLTALFPRTYIDVNRAADDIDPALLGEPWPAPLDPTARSHAGIGLLRRIVSPGLPVYDRLLTADEIRARLDNYYRPYHAALGGLIEEAHYNFGLCWHIDCHSMPAESGRPGLPDFVIGDRDGASCGREFTQALRRFLAGLGYRVALNAPHKGAEILRRHAYPARGRHSLQLEISKSLYWDESANAPSAGFGKTEKNMEKMAAFCAAFISDMQMRQKAAD